MNSYPNRYTLKMSYRLVLSFTSIMIPFFPHRLVTYPSWHLVDFPNTSNMSSFPRAGLKCKKFNMNKYKIMYHMKIAFFVNRDVRNNKTFLDSVAALFDQWPMEHKTDWHSRLGQPISFHCELKIHSRFLLNIQYHDGLLNILTWFYLICFDKFSSAFHLNKDNFR